MTDTPVVFKEKLGSWVREAFALYFAPVGWFVQVLSRAVPRRASSGLEDGALASLTYLQLMMSEAALARLRANTELAPAEQRELEARTATLRAHLEETRSRIRVIWGSMAELRGDKRIVIDLEHELTRLRRRGVIVRVAIDQQGEAKLVMEPATGAIEAADIADATAQR